MKARRFFAVFLLLSMLTAWMVAPQALAVEDPDIQAKAALLVDQESGTIVYEKNIHDELYPASLTKIMTALLVMEAIDQGKLSLDQEITASSSAMSDLDPDGSSAGIEVGETMTVKNYLYCMLVVSANEACNVLAEAVEGSVSDFVDLMNEKAQELGCKNTHFVNATGLHDPQHYTSAWDLYLVTKAALAYPDFVSITDTADVIIPATNLSDQRHLYTTNYLLSAWRALGYIYKNAHGIKTGSTDDSGHCLVSSAVKGSLSFISVVLGAEKVTNADGSTDVKSFSETKRLFEWGFDNFAWQTVLTPNDMIEEVPVTLSREAEQVTAHPAEDVKALLPKDVSVDELEREVTLKSKSVAAPVEEGDTLGTVSLSYEGTVYATAPIVALNSVSASRLLTIWNHIQQFFSKTIVRVIGIILLVLIVLFAIWKLTMGRRRYRYGRSVRRSSGGYRGRRRHR